MSPRIALPVLLLLCATGLSAQRWSQPKSNVTGEACPELLLEEEMVQGPKLTQDDFDGKVVFFMFYRRDCQGCETIAMPRLQKLWERYKDSKCVLVLAINTAFDKETYPYLADVEQTREHLKRMRWEMPVARDFDELSYELFELDEEVGTPQAVIVDQHGTVRDHDWYSAEPEWEHLEATFERLSANLNCDCHVKPREVTRACRGSFDAFEEGDYTKAWDEADAVDKSLVSGDDDRKDAKYMKEFVENLARKKMQRIEHNFYYDPIDALDRAKPVLDKFKGVPGVSKFSARIEEWAKSGMLEDFVKARDELEKIDSEFGEITKKGGVTDDAKAQYLKKLEGIAEKSGNNAIGARARNRIGTVSGKAQPALTRGNRGGGDTAKAGPTRNSGSAKPGADSGSKSRVGSSGSSKPETRNATPRAKTDMRATRSSRSKVKSGG
ncbi:MAG: redoxin domain-containing protein [Planctomycetes bacterium]|nr:redoxin domain-containing protein [Planctomycetota bacterium]